MCPSHRRSVHDVTIRFEGVRARAVSSCEGVWGFRA